MVNETKLDLFGKPYNPSTTHTPFFNKLSTTITGNGLPTKQKYKQEQQKIKQRLENQKYQAKLEETREANLRLTVARTRNTLHNGPQSMINTKRKIGILTGIFK